MVQGCTECVLGVLGGAVGFNEGPECFWVREECAFG